MRHGNKAKAKAKAMAEKETKGSCSRSVRPGVNQTFKVVIFDAGAAVSTVPRKDFEGYISGEPRTTKYKRPQVNFLKITITVK